MGFCLAILFLSRKSREAVLAGGERAAVSPSASYTMPPISPSASYMMPPLAIGRARGLISTPVGSPA